MDQKSHSIRVRALVVVSCGGPKLYVPDCPFCSGTHCHSGCQVPVCSRCAIGKQAGLFFSWGPWNCTPEKLFLLIRLGAVNNFAVNMSITSRWPMARPAMRPVMKIIHVRARSRTIWKRWQWEQRLHVAKFDLTLIGTVDIVRLASTENPKKVRRKPDQQFAAQEVIACRNRLTHQTSTTKRLMSARSQVRFLSAFCQIKDGMPELFLKLDTSGICGAIRAPSLLAAYCKRTLTAERFISPVPRIEKEANAARKAVQGHAHYGSM